MSDKRVSREFFEHYLPQAILTIADLDSLCLQKSTFIDETLQASMADMLYTVNFNERPGYFYIIVEHQRKPDKWMAYRLLRYQVRIMDYHLKKKSQRSLPLIVPMVFYNGDKPYPYSTDLFDLFGEQQPLAKDVLFRPFTLIDLTQISDDVLKKMQWVGIMGLVQKHIATRDFMNFLKRLLPLLKHLESAGAEDYLISTLTYLLQADIEDPEETAKLIHNELSSRLGGEVMTLAERLEERGFHKGKLEGEKVGFEKGRNEEKLLIAQQMLKQNVDTAFVVKVTGLTLEEMVELI